MSDISSTSDASCPSTRSDSRPNEILNKVPNEVSRVDSRNILGAHRYLEIVHHGEVYRLRNTRLGKLILTK